MWRKTIGKKCPFDEVLKVMAEMYSDGDWIAPE
jgi:hypothetical protein